MINDENLRSERLSLLIGLVMGQIAQLLNNIKTIPLTNDLIYKDLRDISDSASLQIHELFYKGNKRE